MQKSRKNAHLNFTIGTNEFCDYIMRQNNKTTTKKSDTMNYEEIRRRISIRAYLAVRGIKPR
nr:MAG TPA: hypothetical protein [Caudoviricetes sp.]